MGSAENDSLFVPAQEPKPVDLSHESDGGIVCELRNVWRELEGARKSIESAWPNGAWKYARLQSLIRMQCVIAEAGRRLKAQLKRAADAASDENEAGF